VGVVRVPTEVEADAIIASLTERGLLAPPAQVLDHPQAETASKGEQAPAQPPRVATDQREWGRRADSLGEARPP
jgi:hypothetical protein